MVLQTHTLGLSRARHATVVVGLVSVVSLVFPTLAAAAPTHDAVYAVVVGSNRSLDTSLPLLRFADDDAVRYHELFTGLGGEARLLTVLDADSQGRFRRARQVAAAPTYTQLLKALDHIFARIGQANARGRRTVFYFVFSGHGSVAASGQGQLHLLDRMFSRLDLYRHVLGRSPARYNHIIIDACHAYFMVHPRGRWRRDKRPQDLSRLLDRFLRNERIEQYPNTGLLLATASSAETHEWSRIEAGLFSHQVRSAIAGAADVTNDGEVSYPELAAYISAANSRVENRRAVLQVFARPPSQNLDEPLMRLGGSTAQRVRLARALTGHHYIEDQRGSRYADFNKSSEAPLTIWLSSAVNRYYLRGPMGERIIDAGTSTPRTVEIAQMQPMSLVEKGAVDEALQRGLYQVPFGPSFFAGYQAVWRQTLQEPLPAVTEQAVASDSREAARWRLGLGYLLTRPALGRPGLVHGVTLDGARQVLPWLDTGLGAHYATGDGESWQQHRVAVMARATARYRPTSWFGLLGRFGLGYLALLESVGQERRGDVAAFTLGLDGGAEVRLATWLWLAAQGGFIWDLLDEDGTPSGQTAGVMSVGFEAQL